MATTATVKWVKGRIFEGTSGSGHTITMSGPPAEGEGDAGVRPMELLLLGMGGCTSYDVMDILEKGRQPVEGCVVEVEGERAETVPKVYTRIHLTYVVSGRGLDPAKVERAVNLSLEKYCSVTLMLAKAAEITHEIKLVD
ncbi:MAG: OsmC family protein [Rhodospirillales bacterium]|nr:OsmC family protein [Rhodospirillales bacterium]